METVIWIDVNGMKFIPVARFFETHKPQPFPSSLSGGPPPPGFFVFGRIMQRKLRCCPATSTPLEAVIRHTKHGAR